MMIPLKKGDVINATTSVDIFVKYVIVKDYKDKMYRLLNLNSMNIMSSFIGKDAESARKYITDTLKCKIVGIERSKI